SLSQDARYALSGGGQFLIRPKKGTIPLRVEGQLAFSDGCERLFTSGQLKLWDVAAGRCLPTFQGHADAITAVALGYTSRYALTGGGLSVLQHQTGRFVQSGPIYIWEVATGRCLCQLNGHAGAVTSVCLSMDERFALSGGTDATLKLWETAGGRCLRTFAGHQDAVTALALSGDGRFALSGSADRTVKLWILDWELEDQQPADWDERARPYLETFLNVHTPYAAVRTHGQRTVKEIMQLPLSQLFRTTPRKDGIAEALVRRGSPRFTEKDFQVLMHM